MESKNHQKGIYPSHAQSWGIVGIAILAMLVFIPAQSYLNNLFGNDAGLFLYYALAMGAVFIFAHFLRKKETGQSSYNFELASPKVIGLVAVTIIALHLGLLVPLANSIPMPDVFREIFMQLFSNSGFFTFLSVVIVAPVIEEIIFRGIILDGLLKRYSPQKSIIISSLLFGIVHLNPWQFAGAFLIGIFIGWVYYKTGKLTLAILIHFVNNLIGFIPVYFADSDMLQEVPTRELYGTPLVTFAVLLLCLTIASIGIVVLNQTFIKKN